MRKVLFTPLIAVIMLAMTAAMAMADSKEQIDVYDHQKQLVKSVVFIVGFEQYFVDGQTPGISMDAKPFIETGRTFVPIRYLSNALGVTDDHIGWESPKVTLDEPGFPVVELAVGSKTIKSDDQTKTMDVAPILRQGRTYLPARFVAETLGYQVEWLPENNIVLCWPKGAEKPDISAVIEHVKGQVTPVQPPVQPVKPVLPEGKPIDMTGKGEPLPQPLHKYESPNSKITWLTYDEFNSNVYKLGTVETYGMRVTKDQVYITQKGGCGGVALYEGGDIYRSRSSSGPPEAREQKWEYGYTVSLPSDITIGWGSCDITKVSHILFHCNGTFLGIENPMYKGGK